MDQKYNELFRVPYSVSTSTSSGTTPFHHEDYSGGGVVHISALSPDKAKELALGQLRPRYDEGSIGFGKVSLVTFVDMWRDQTSEELFQTYIANAPESDLVFYERRAAARLLAERQYEPVGEVLLRWLNNPEQGMVHPCTDDPPFSSRHNVFVTDFHFQGDVRPRDIRAMATESLGLMRYGGARSDLERLANDDGIRGEDPGSYVGLQFAKGRLDNPDFHYAGKGCELEHDLLIFIAATSPKDFFRTSLFKGMVNQIIANDPDYWCSSNTKLAERYIEALRRLPDLRLPVVDPNAAPEMLMPITDYAILQHVGGSISKGAVAVPEIDLTAFLARKGINMDIAEFEEICGGVLSTVREESGLTNGRGQVKVSLFDGTTPWVNGGVKMEILKYLKEKSINLYTLI